MRKEYDFSESKRNPYLKKLKKQISIQLDIDTIRYFKSLSEETGVPYQNLINAYLADCVARKRKPELVWQESE